jgi:peroxiredoxin
MKRSLWFLLTLVMIAAIGLTLTTHESADASVADAAQPAPGFTLTDTHGKQHKLSDFAGKFVVLEWLNHDCPFVHKHYDSKNMQTLQARYTGKGVIWLSIVSSAPGKQGHYSADDLNRLTAEKGASPTAVLLDPDGAVGKLYGAKTTPHMFVISPKGEILYKGAIDDRRSTDLEDVPKARNFVVEALDAAMAGKPVEIAATQPYGCAVKY